MPRLTMRDIQTARRPDPNYRKASLLKINKENSFNNVKLEHTVFSSLLLMMKLRQFLRDSNFARNFQRIEKTHVYYENINCILATGLHFHFYIFHVFLGRGFIREI